MCVPGAALFPLLLLLLLLRPVAPQIYVCANHEPDRGCRLNDMKILADTSMDFKTFAGKVCDFLTTNATIITANSINMDQFLYTGIDNSSYNFYQYTLLAYALDTLLPISYNIVNYNKLHSKVLEAATIRRTIINPYSDIWLEFGVEKGFSINVTMAIKEKHSNISLTSEDTLFGFDWFNGLPIEWSFNNGKGAYSMKGAIPNVRNGVKLIVGLFNDTVPTFLSDETAFGDNKRIGFVNIDNDLYEGARDILVWLTQSGRMRFGAILHFHELVRRKDPNSKCYGQEELLGLYDAMRLLRHIKVELLPYHHSYFQSVLFRYLTVKRNNIKRINTNIKVPYTYGGDEHKDKEVIQYVKDSIFFKFYNATTKETKYLDTEQLY